MLTALHLSRRFCLWRLASEVLGQLWGRARFRCKSSNGEYEVKIKANFTTVKTLASISIFLASSLIFLRAETIDHPFVCPLFCDNMVLQRDQPDPVWGWTTPGQEVTITIGNQSAKATAGTDGKWIVKLTPPPAGGPYDLTVAGTQTVTFHNVAVGDVWFCSGQSNMDFGVGQADNAAQEIANANQPQIRLFMEGKKTGLHPTDDLKGEWQVCTPETVAAGGWKGFSAVAYFFGRELQQKLKVPIGLIQSSVGSTPAEAWTGRDSLAKAMPELKGSLDEIDQVEAMMAGKSDEEKRQITSKLRADWYHQVAIDPAISTPDYSAESWKTMRDIPRHYGDSGDPDLKSFLGVILFRKEITLPDTVVGKAATLNIGNVDDQDVTWVNGTQIGATVGGNPRHYKLAAGLLKPGRNVIVVWMLNGFGPGGIVGKPEELSLDVEGSQPLSLAGDWQYQISTPADKMPPSLFSVAGNFGFPTEIFNGMVAPVAPFGIKGVLWYQGEANAGRANRYAVLLQALIESWRARWQQGNFPFFVVQLPNFSGGQGMVDMREAQAQAVQRVPEAGLVTTIDIGEPGNLHPPHKQEVGHRLALLALAKAYGQSIPFSGPVYQSLKAEGNTVRISFADADGLKSKDGGPLIGFEVAGSDQVYHAAQATIDGKDVVLTSTDVPQPITARYDWAPSPKGNLYNQADLPAAPFRTDIAEAAAP